MEVLEQEDRGTLGHEGLALVEEPMVREDRWQEIHRLFREERMPIAEIARQLELDRKTVRRWLKQVRWRPYRRPAATATRLTKFAEYARTRAPQVRYSAQVLYQELRRRGYAGSYDTVKRFVRPLRTAEALAERATVRFETPPGRQSQIDWGSARVHLREERVVLHLFVLTLGYSRRHYLEPCPNERIPQLLDAHERAFDHFGGHAQEHLYDRPRTICQPDGQGGVVWNGTFQSFARYWGFEVRLCRPYRARTKGKVESGVKYVKRNFLAGRTFVDLQDVREQWAEWNATVSEVRLHGTTHQRPIDRFAEEARQLVRHGGRAGFRLEARFPRTVATDYLVTLDTNRYSVPFALIGQSVEVERRDGEVRVWHQGRPVASHPELTGRHQLRVLPEHGPGAVARNARLRTSTPSGPFRGLATDLAVEERDLALYEEVCQVGGEA